jgi:hypothetical protein
LVVVVLLGFGGAAYLTASVPPTASSWYPKCMFHAATGLHCPGCGLTRAAHALLNGHPLAAFSYHLFAPVLFLLAALAVVRGLVRWALREPQANRRPIRPFWPWLCVAALLAYTVARNIPAEPFSHLAPKEIEPEVQTPQP